MASTSFSDTVGDARNSSSSATLNEEGNNSTAVIPQSVYPNATAGDGPTLVSPWTAAEHLLSFPGCSESPTSLRKESQVGSGTRSAKFVLSESPIQRAADNVTAAEASAPLRLRSGDVKTRAPFCRICCFRRQLCEQQGLEYRGRDPGPPSGSSSAYSPGDVVV